MKKQLPKSHRTPQSYIGEKVTWKTPLSRRIADGSFTSIREGIAIYYLRPFIKPTQCQEVLDAKASQCFFGYGKTGGSSNPRLIIRVERTGKNGRVLQPHYFAPRVSSILTSQKIDEKTE
ncbi:hypothetical protein [Nodosilinea nodulosa]|uniref:hypothetical protein n=1 Tax=Nodosilinea nodulosa TaxID=416001 RepID=UPI0012D83C00|nr:hypothetical protein [Nodosilinea nodulosa]